MNIMQVSNEVIPRVFPGMIEIRVGLLVHVSQVQVNK